MTAFAAQCHHIAGRLTRQAVSVAVFVTLMLAVATTILILSPGPHPVSTASLALASLATGIASLALSALLYFDAALFTLMATYPDELSAGRAVDDFLARSKLKPLPATTRPLSSRVAGTHRLMRRQLVLAALFTIVTVLALALNFA